MLRLMPIGVAFVLGAAFLTAQSPGEKQPQGQAKQNQKDFSESSIVKRMMAFNKTEDGKLTKEQVTDPRLHRLFDLADANKDGIVTREELMALAARMDVEYGQGGPGGKGFGGPKGSGGKGKGPGGFGGPPQGGEILAPFLQEQLNLTSAQKKQINDLQRQVDGKLAKILTEPQRQQLKDMRDRGPGGFGPPGRSR